MGDFVEPKELLDVFRRAAAALQRADVPFVLGGGLAAWAYGGPMTEHDVDLFVTEEDCAAALEALSDAGFETSDTPEGWLVKAWWKAVLVDVIYRPVGLEINRELIESCPMRSVHAIPVRVLSVEDVLATKLLSLTEHHLDYGPVLACARSLRELVDWTRFGRRISGSPFARAFLYLVIELGVCPERDALGTGAPAKEHA